MFGFLKNKNVEKVVEMVTGDNDTAEKAIKMITGDTIIGDILKMDASVAPIFMSIGMHCLGCPSAQAETVAQACAVHGVDCDALIETVNKFLADKK